MKLLFDFLPVVLFFITFKLGESNRDAAAEAANRYFGGLVSGGVVEPAQAPIVWATVVAIVATLCQVLWKLARGRRVDPMLWASLLIIVVFGGATIWLHDENFIKWKPTVLYWLFGAALVLSQAVFRKNLIKSSLEAQVTLPDTQWRRLNLAWVGFFSAMGIVNLYVAYHYTLEAWVSFKLFGFVGAMIAFVIAQGIWLARHMREDIEGVGHGRER